MFLFYFSYFLFFLVLFSDAAGPWLLTGFLGRRLTHTAEFLMNSNESSGGGGGVGQNRGVRSPSHGCALRTQLQLPKLPVFSFLASSAQPPSFVPQKGAGGRSLHLTCCDCDLVS